MRRRRRKYYDDIDLFDLQKPRRVNWEKVCGAFFGFVFAALSAILWIALFSGIDIEFSFIYLPTSTILCFISFHFYMRELSNMDIIGWLVIAIYAANSIVSVVGWFSDDISISSTSICHSIILALLLERFPKD